MKDEIKKKLIKKNNLSELRLTIQTSDLGNKTRITS